MRGIIAIVISMSSIWALVMTYQTVGKEECMEQQMESALSVAMYQTMSEVMEKNSYGIENRNEMMAAFLQAMIKKVDSEMDLTVYIHDFQYDTGIMDVEAIGEFVVPGEKCRKVSVRRQVEFVTK